MLLSKAWELYESDKRIFRWPHEEGHIPKNPAAKIKETKQGKRIPKFLNDREIEHLREACFTPMEKALKKVFLKGLASWQ